MKRYTILLLSALLYFPTVHAQFYTIKAKEHVPFKIIKGESKNTTSEITTDLPAVSSEKEEENAYEKELYPIRYSSPLDCTLSITSKYGFRSDPFTNKRKFHSGIDLSARGNTIMSMLQGEIKKVGYDKKGLGKYVILQHGDFEVTYGHLSSVLVRKKEKVKAGTPVGISGSTGRATGEHLHLSLKLKGKKVDPLPFLLFIQQKEKNEGTSYAYNSTKNQSTI